MDDKYSKYYEKHNSKSQFHEQLESKWTPVNKEKQEWHHKPSIENVKKRLKPDPATVEAELRLEEELWAS